MLIIDNNNCNKCFLSTKSAYYTDFCQVRSPYLYNALYNTDLYQSSFTGITGKWFSDANN